MATILSNPTTITVRGAGTTALSSLASSMSPGTWAQLNVSNQDAVLRDIGVTGSMLPYCNKTPWNPVTKCIEIVAGDHLGATPDMKHVRYDEATNQFSTAQSAPAVPGIGHGNDHSAVNPFTGDLYHRLYSGFTGRISCMKKAAGAGSFANIPSVTASEQVAMGTCWWSGSFTGAGAQGAFMIYNTGVNGGQILAFNPLTNSWFYSQTNKAPGSSSGYSSVMDYSARKNVAVYGGGNGAPSSLWRMSSDGSVVAMPAAPSGKVGLQMGILVTEPVTGNFLLLSSGSLWELNPSGSGTWTKQSGSRTPPGAVGIPSSSEHLVACAIPDYGVVAFITQNLASGGTFYLYKHA
jgi:hypothetical protein